jgi:hypothetical protein
MKRYSVSVWLAIVSMTIFCACHKAHNPTPTPPPNQQYNVNINVGFSRTITNFDAVKGRALATSTATTTNIDTLKKYLGVLRYHIYDSNNHEVRNGTQHPSDSGFGTIATQLANGTYTVIVDAGDTTLIEASYLLKPTGTSPPGFSYPCLAYQYASPAVYPANSTSSPFKANTFYNKTTITVNGSSTSYSIDLARVVAQLQIKIGDIIPANAKSLTVIVTKDAQALALANLSVEYATPYYYNITPVTPGSKFATISLIIANTMTGFNVELKSTDGVVTSPSQIAGYNVVGDKVIQNVTCMQNETTILSGNLFNGTDQGFTITYNPQWDPGTPTTIHF